MFAGGGRQKTGSRGTGFDARPSPLQSIPELKTDIRTFCSALFFRARSSMGETIQPGLYQPLFLQAKDPAVPEGPKGGFIPAKGEREEAVRSVQRPAQESRSLLSDQTLFPDEGVDPFRMKLIIACAEPSAGQCPADSASFHGKGRDALQQGDGKAFIGCSCLVP